MKIQIDRQNDVPRITENGKLVYSEKSDTLFIRTLKEGTKAIGSNSSIVESDPIFQAWLSTPPNISIFTNDVGYLTSFSEIDPIFTAWQTLYDNHTDWDTAYSWGNHASVGYLTSSALTPYLTSATAAVTYQPIGSYLTSITSSNVTTALGYTPVTNARTLTINGTTYDLTADRSWTISTGTTYTFSTGLTNIAGTITSNLSTGVSGGQSVVGGTLSGNNLTLSSTSNATKGKILFGTSAYDEVNNRLGIGTATPGISGFDTKLHIRGTSTGVSGRTAFVVENTAADSAASFILQNAGGKYLGAQVSGASYVGGESAGFSTVGGLNLNFGTDGGVNSGGTSKINFTTGGWQNNPTMTITGGNPGNVGIRTTTPSTALEIANGGTLKLGGGTASGQGNILMNSNASSSYDTNLIYLGSNSQTMGMIASSTPSFDSSYGSSIFLRGNSYGAISGQRGIAGLLAGNPSSPTAGEGELRFLTGATLLRMVINNSGNIGFGISTPTAVLHLKAGTATAGTAPVKFTTGTNTTVAVAGQMEYNNTFHLTNSDATRRHVVLAPNTTKVTASAPYTNDGYIVVNIAGTDFKILTTA